MPVFGVVAVAVSLLGIGVLVVALKLALGNIGGIMWDGHEVVQFGKYRACGLGLAAVWLWVRSRWHWRACKFWFAAGCK